MADPLQHVSQGAPLRISAATFNALMDSARLSRRTAAFGPRALGGRPVPLPGPALIQPSLSVLVQNDTGIDLTEPYGILAIKGSPLDPSANSQAQAIDFRRRPCFSGGPVVNCTDPIVICSGPIPEGELGEAVIAGVALCYLCGWGSGIDDAPQFACALPGDVTQLIWRPATVSQGYVAKLGGPARVLWVGPNQDFDLNGGFGRNLAVVLLGPAPPPPRALQITSQGVDPDGYYDAIDFASNEEFGYSQLFKVGATNINGGVRIQGWLAPSDIVVATPLLIRDPLDDTWNGEWPRLTTIAASIEPGVQTVTPGSLAGLLVNMAVKINDGGDDYELVAIMSIGAGTFTANFTRAHAGGATVSADYRDIGTLSGGVSAGSAIAVTPSTMTGVSLGQLLLIGRGTAACELVEVIEPLLPADALPTGGSITGFSANLASDHTSGDYISYFRAPNIYQATGRPRQQLFYGSGLGGGVELNADAVLLGAVAVVGGFGPVIPDNYPSLWRLRAQGSCYASDPATTFGLGFADVAGPTTLTTVPSVPAPQQGNFCFDVVVAINGQTTIGVYGAAAGSAGVAGFGPFTIWAEQIQQVAGE